MLISRLGLVQFSVASHGVHRHKICVDTLFFSGEKPFKCDQCDFACIQSFDLVKHKFTHSGDKPYKCEMCPKQFTRPARLRDHMRTHTGEKPYICDVCGKGFAIQTGLKSHQVNNSRSQCCVLSTVPKEYPICIPFFPTVGKWR